MSVIVIESPEKMNELLSNVLRPYINSDYVVDRKFIQQNLQWSRAKIESLECKGLLNPVNIVDADNNKTKFYSLAEIEQLKNKFK